MLQALKQLLQEKEAADPKGWAYTQQQIQTAKLQRTRLNREIEDMTAALLQADEETSHGTKPHLCTLSCMAAYSTHCL